jgi:GNAT superfamily N-acetyltransferase
MGTMVVEVGPEIEQFILEICARPEQHVIQIFASIGCGALKFHQRRPAELKRMWIAPAARGLGVGRRLLGELERTAGEAGVVVLRLETNRALSEAIALYKRSGYVEVKAFNAEPYAHHWFEKTLGKKTQTGRVQ